LRGINKKFWIEPLITVLDVEPDMAFDGGDLEMTGISLTYRNGSDPLNLQYYCKIIPGPLPLMVLV